MKIREKTARKGCRAKRKSRSKSQTMRTRELVITRFLVMLWRRLTKPLMMCLNIPIRIQPAGNFRRPTKLTEKTTDEFINI